MPNFEVKIEIPYQDGRRQRKVYRKTVALSHKYRGGSWVSEAQSHEDAVSVAKQRLLDEARYTVRRTG